MNRMQSYKWTSVACYLGYITQAISINLLPLLYVTFQNQFSISLQQIGLTATVIFVVQLCVDVAAARLARYISYRSGCIAAHVFATLGLVLMSVLPMRMADPFAGVLLAAVLLSVGGGLTEVLISPVMDAMPNKEKTGAMSLLHSFYCWGVVAVVLFSTLFFAVLSPNQWPWLTLLWALVPGVTTVLFCVVPLPEKPEERSGGERWTIGRLLKSGMVWLLLVMMICSGAAEMAPGQWASLFAEEGLGVSKTWGDLLGPCAFALLQGTARLLFGRVTRRRSPTAVLAVCAMGCVTGYLLIALSPWPWLSLLGFCVCGLAVGPMWPGVLSISAGRYPTGGTTLFALLALCGDLGCSTSPGLVGLVSDRLCVKGYDLTSSLRGGFGVCMLFPIGLAVGLWLLYRKEKSADGLNKVRRYSCIRFCRKNN